MLVWNHAKNLFIDSLFNFGSSPKKIIKDSGPDLHNEKSFASFQEVTILFSLHLA